MACFDMLAIFFRIYVEFPWCTDENLGKAVALLPKSQWSILDSNPMCFCSEGTKGFHICLNFGNFASDKFFPAMMSDLVVKHQRLFSIMT